MFYPQYFNVTRIMCDTESICWVEFASNSPYANYRLEKLEVVIEQLVPQLSKFLLLLLLLLL